ncbi:MAG: hypothetical protein WCG25_02285 [bacterium]
MPSCDIRYNSFTQVASKIASGQAHISSSSSSPTTDSTVSVFFFISRNC